MEGKLLSSRLELAVEGGEARELEYGEEIFGGQLRAPVPRRSEAAVDARASVEKVVGAGAVESVTEEILQDGGAQPKHAAPRGVDPAGESRILVQLVEGS